MWKGLTKERTRAELCVDAEARRMYVLRPIGIDDLIISQNINTQNLMVLFMLKEIKKQTLLCYLE